MDEAPPALCLEFLLVSGNVPTVKAAKAALEELGGTLDCAATAGAARDRIKTRKVDGIILDLDLKPALELVADIRRGRLNARAFVFVAVRSEVESAAALKGGADALLTRPLSAKAIASNLNTFRSIMACERRRYQRHPVTLPVVVTLDKSIYQGIVENVSQGGMGVRLPCLLAASSVVEFAFDLPTGPTIEGKAQLRWANRDGLIGMQFHGFSPTSKAEFMAWLRQQPLTTEPVSPSLQTVEAVLDRIG